MEPFKLDATKLDKVTRFEVIDEQGRAYVKYEVEDLELVFQDDDKTLKVWVKASSG